jgi:hypothetical protein
MKGSEGGQIERKLNLMQQLFLNLFFKSIINNTSHSNFMFTKTTILFNEGAFSQFLV